MVVTANIDVLMDTLVDAQQARKMLVLHGVDSEPLRLAMERLILIENRLNAIVPRMFIHTHPRFPERKGKGDVDGGKGKGKGDDYGTGIDPQIAHESLAQIDPSVCLAEESSHAMRQALFGDGYIWIGNRKGASGEGKGGD